MHALWPIFIFSFSMGLTPGPNNLLLMSSGLNFGAMQTIRHYFGVALGFPMMMLIIAIGFGSLFTELPWLRTGLKIVGSGYMLYLAWRMLQSSEVKTKPNHFKPWGFWQAAAFQWINPKAWLIGIGIISIFKLHDNPYLNALAISSVTLFVSLITGATWVWLGAWLQRVLKTAQHRRWFNGIMAAGLFISVILIYFD